MSEKGKKVTEDNTDGVAFHLFYYEACKSFH